MSTQTPTKPVCAHCGEELPPDPKGGVKYQIVTRMQPSRIPLSEKWCERCYAESQVKVNEKQTAFSEELVAAAKKAMPDVEVEVIRAPAAQHGARARRAGMRRSR